MATHRLMVELSEEIFQQLSRIAQLTQQSVETLAAQCIASNLPPAAVSASPQMQAELAMMQTQSIEELLKVARSPVPSTQEQRQLELLEKNQTASMTAEERQEFSDLHLAGDQLMLRKAYAWALLRWRGYPAPALEELTLE